MLRFLIFFLTGSFPRRLRLKKLGQTDPEASFALASSDIKTACRKMLKIAGTDLTVSGLENIPDEPVLFVGNHCSYFDIVAAIASLPNGAGFVAKDVIKKVPGIRGYMDLIHCLYLDRKDLKKGVEMIKEGIELIRSGYSMVIYPEGTRSKDGKVGEFKGGALKMAQRSDAPIVIMACTGTRDIYENNPGFRIRPAKATLTFSKPFRISELPKEDRRFAARYTRNLLLSMLKKEGIDQPDALAGQAEE